MDLVWYYHADGNAATRLIRALVRSAGLAVPTGFSIDENVNFPHQSDLSLIANEEGIVYAYHSPGGGDFYMRNDNGSVTVEDNTTAGGIFPILVEENDLISIFFSVTNELAGDRHSLYLLQEEWLEV